MDPYLEDLSWMNFHNQFCAEIARQLGPKVRPRYLARLTERYFSEIALEADEPERLSYPDVSVTESAPGPGRGGAVAVATVAAPGSRADAVADDRSDPAKALPPPAARPVDYERSRSNTPL
jgi:hypothetical protein